ncbi:hypothetical protein EB837_01655 [Kluyvera ascorbata]|uniref:Uncharacterized protein n=1 Tax=Kluyvera ascorbata TaxID=51288 RepID=A0A3N2SFU6_9ENTR|nr:hypothetical protein EB837_01655 [Kluyvera ascorbata]
MLLYCLFLRGAPHRFEAKIAVCTIMVPPMSCCGATWLRRSGMCSLLIILSNWRARMGVLEGEGACRPDKRSAIRRDTARLPDGGVPPYPAYSRWCTILLATLAQAHHQRTKTKQRGN